MTSTPSSYSTDMLTDDLKTKLVFFGNEFPNDDLRELFRRLQRHSKDKRFPFLSLFLEECSAVIKDEAAKLPQHLQELIPPFHTVLTLADHGDFRRGPLGAAMESALLCVLEIGMLIGHYESQKLDYDLNHDNTTLAGLSIGIMAAASVSLASSIADLAYTGGECVRVSFRLGTYVDNVSRSLEPRDAEGTLESWAYVVTGLDFETVQREIDTYNTETCNPSLTKVFVSAADQGSISVTGPPTRLKNAFRRSEVLRYSKFLALPVYDGLCHASHLYDVDDINVVINGSEPRVPRSRRVLIPLLSSQTGKPFPAKTAGELFTQIGAELLTGTIYLDNVTEGIMAAISNSAMPDCDFTTFRTSIVAKGILAQIDSDLPQIAVSRQDLIEWSSKDFEPRIPRTPKQSKLAVVGMSCRLPGGANDHELFWKILEEARDVHTTVPPDRFDLTTHYDPTGKTANATQVPYGNFIDNPGFFDAGFFNMSPREAEETDPMHRLALVTAYEALEMAGFSPNRTPSTNLKRVGTFYGQASDDWRELNASQNIGTYAVPGGERAFANGRIHYFFKFCGPSFNIDTACSSGLAAVNAACSSLWSGEADTVLAGGLNVITDPDNYCGLGSGWFLSKTGQCKVWDKDADGYCRADGVGSIVIKRLEDAEADNDNILATIVAGATNQSANAVSITHPHAGAQKDNYNQVMQEAGMNPLDVSYIELHGTGTQAGDAQESESVADIFAPVSPRRRSDQRLRVGAAKCNIGHGEAAAGIASMVKMLLMFQKSSIPPHIGIKTEINPTIPKDLEKRNMGLCFENTPWPRPKGKKRLAVVNSFGAHGGNTTILLEDAPEKRKIGEDPRTTYPITLSAKSKNSLRGNIEALMAFLTKHPDTDIGDLSYTTCARRIHHSNRIATSVTSVEQLQKWLASSLENVGNIRPIPVDPPAIAFTFTGQGAFYNGIGSQLFRDFPYYRTQVIQLDQLVRKFGFPSVIPAIDGTTEGSQSPVVTQLTILVTDIALARLWTLFGLKPSAVIGHSLGEYAAMAVAGVISAADAIYLVGKRAEQILATCEQGSHVMLWVHASVDDIAKAAGEHSAYEISCINGRNDIVISGAHSKIEATRGALESAGFKCRQLDLPFAFHTVQMDSMLDSFEELSRNVTFKAPSIPIISPLLATCVFDGKTINSDYLRRAMREPVDFVGALDAAMDMEIVDEKTIWVDIGPHPVSGNFVRQQIDGARAVFSLRRNEDSFAILAASLCQLHADGVPLVWNEYFKPYELAHTLLPLSSYRWNHKNYWIQYIGTWTLDKAHIKENLQKKAALGTLTATGSTLRTSLVHQVTAEKLGEATGTFAAVSDIMHPDFLAAMHGHTMNNCGVATSSIWGDMSLTIGEYLYKRMVPKTKEVHMNVTGMEVLHAQVAQKVTSSAQLLQTEATIDLSKQSTLIQWYNILDDGSRAPEAFASATVRYEDPAAWQAEWDRVSHLVSGRMEELHRLAANSVANKLNKNMAYTLFKNVVDYAPKYRGMDSVVLYDYEACCDITLVKERHGTWHTPPHWIDSVSHLAGLVMNGSDASNTKDFFYVTPGCESFRLAKPLQPGAKYRAYVKMFPTPIEAHMRTGDIYIFQDDAVVGMVGQIKFRRVPRVLIDQFFSAPDSKKKIGSAGHAAPKPAVPAPAAAAAVAPAAPAPTPAVPAQAPSPAAPAPEVTVPAKAGPETTVPAAPATAAAPVAPAPVAPAPVAPAPVAPAPVAPAPDAASGNPMVNDCMGLIARETGLDAAELNDEATFVSIGVDSLMSLVLAEKFRAEVGLEVKSSLFIECPTVGELKGWLEQYC